MGNAAMMNPKTRKLVLSLALGGIAGFALSYFLLGAVDDGALGNIDSSASAAALTGGFYILMALFVGLGTLSPSAGARFLNVEDAEELQEQRRVLLFSSGAMLAWGAALIALALASEGGPISRTPAALVAVTGLAIGIVLAWRSYRLADELMMAVNRETASLSYYLAFAILGGWGVLAHLGYIEGPQPLDLVTAFYVLVLLATFFIAGRRGMLRMR